MVPSETWVLGLKYDMKYLSCIDLPVITFILLAAFGPTSFVSFMVIGYIFFLT